MSTVIRVEDVSKQYRLGKVGTGTFAQDLNIWWHTIRGKENPYLKIGETNDRTKAGNSDYVWALQDINFDIQKGDVVGIIGRNGAGKSTLLKLLSKTTTPTTGSIKINGRIASLLEVGTGFHPDLSGRENIFLNGAILGMTKKEIKRKFDEIVDFAGVERYIDTPVKRYSSGMYVRLAFGVAAHLESEILIVDEVLAVGDAEFQKKCLGKMKDVSQGEGRTVLFVSHNMASIKALCTKGIFLQFGTLKYSGSIETAIEYYQDSIKGTHDDIRTSYTAVPDMEKEAQILGLRILNKKGEEKKEFDVWDPVFLEFKMDVRKEGLQFVTPIIAIEKDGVQLFWSFASDLKPEILNGLSAGTHTFTVPLPHPLKKGFYQITAKIGKLRVNDLDKVTNAVQFMIDEFSFDPTNKSFSSLREGLVPALLDWKETL